MKRRYLTPTQRAVLGCMAANGGRAVIYTGVRWSRFSPGFAHIFGQGLHTLLHNRWITSRGQNERCSFAWTDEGRDVFERGWYYPATHVNTWLDEKPLPAADRDEGNLS